MPHLLPAAASAIAAASAAKAGVMATLKSVAFKAITNMAISAALSALQPQVGGQGGRTFEWTIDPDAPIPFAAGQVGVAGSVVHRDTFGPDLMYYGIPAVLSGAGPITGYDSVKADDFTVTFDSSGKAITSTYAGELWFKSTLGNQPDVALSSPTGLKNGATLPGWTSAHKLSGKAAYMVVMGENSKGSAFPTGEIKPLITFRGLKGWDPRLDSTYPGGAGSCRLDNPATWVYLTNPILWALKWSLGLWEGPTGKGAPQVDHQVGGIGAKLSGIDVPAFVAAANIADANGWTVSAYPNTDDDKHQVLEAFLQAGGAIYSQRAGKISCIQRAAPRTSIVTISAADTAGPLEIDTAASRIDRINTIRPRFWSPAHRWQMTAMDEVTAASYQTEDGGKRTRGIDYPFVSNAKQAGQLAALQIANTREGIAGVIPLKPHLQRIRPGDAFTITEAGFVLNGLKCLCLNTDYDPATGVVRVSFVSETDAKYPFALGQNPTPPTPQVLTPVDPGYVTPPVPGDWTIVPRPPGTGGQVPGFDLSGAVGNSTATAIEVEWWEVPGDFDPNDPPPANAFWQSAGVFPPTATTIPINVQPDRYYWIGLTYIRNQNYSARTVSGPWLAGKLIADDVDPTSPTIQDIFGEIGSVEDAMALIDADLTAAEGLLASQGAEIVAARGGQSTLGARILQVNQARIDGDQTNAAAINLVSTEVATARQGQPTLSARVSQLNQARIDGDATNAQVIAQQGQEIEAARGGQASLSARIAQVNQARIDGDTAISQTVTGLTARTAATEADVIDLELAQANETMARVQSVNQLTARMAVQPNLLPNSTLVSDTAKWTMGNWFRYVDRFGPGFRVATTAAAQVADSDYISDGISQNTAYTLSGEMLAGAFLGGQVRVALEFWDATTRLVQHVALALNPGESAGAWRERTFSVVSPAGTTRARLRLVDASTTAGIVVRLRRLKLETGNVATLWTDDAQIAGISAGVTNAANAIVDLQANKASATALTATQAQVADLDAETLILSESIADAEAKLSEARLVFIANGGSGQPARIGLYSDNHGGSAVALDAAKIWFGLNTVFDDATDTIQTVWGSTRKVMAWGAPFGPDNLVEWTGPSSTALSAMTKANAGFWVDQFGAYGPTPAPTFWARVTPTAIAKTRMGAGSISSAVNEVIVSCYTGTSGATCTWSRVSGDTTISFPSTGFTPTFSTTLAVGQTKEALFAGLVTKNGEVAVVYLSVAFQETT